MRDLKDRDQRHPEKAHKADTPILRKPDWIRVKAPTSEGYKRTRDIINRKIREASMRLNRAVWPMPLISWGCPMW